MKKNSVKNSNLEKNHGEIVEIMLNSTKIIPNLSNLIDSGKFSVSVKSETKQLIIKKNTHHKFNFVIIFEQCVFSKDSFKPSNIEIYYYGEKSGDYVISQIPTCEQSVNLKSLGMKYFIPFKQIIIKF